MLPVQECSKKDKNSPIFSKNVKFTLTLMSKEKFIFLLQIQILHFKYVWNLPSMSLARFFLIQNELGTIWFGSSCRIICIASYPLINNKIMKASYGRSKQMGWATPIKKCCFNDKKLSWLTILSRKNNAQNCAKYSLHCFSNYVKKFTKCFEYISYLTLFLPACVTW